MSYREFTLKDIRTKLGIEMEEELSLYDDVTPVSPPPALVEWLRENEPLATAINTEKARSELIIAPVLLEVRRLLDKKIGFFSGREFNVDPARGLNGVCDFMLSLSRERYMITAPLMVVVEAKNEDMVGGLPQCLAEMYAVQLYNQQESLSLPAVHGAVSTGTNWRFLKLSGQNAWIDVREYYLHELGTILGILCSIIRPALRAVSGPM
jgi:hypothetical protein